MSGFIKETFIFVEIGVLCFGGSLAAARTIISVAMNNQQWLDQHSLV